MTIPVVDLFAGPGGLGEGFAASRPRGGPPRFRVALSIENDPVARSASAADRMTRWIPVPTLTPLNS